MNAVNAPASDPARIVARAARLNVVVGIALLLVKTAAWWETRSVALLADALESIVNVAAAGAAALAVAVSRRPPDPPCFQLSDTLPARSCLAVPVKGRSGESIGALFFGHSRPRCFGAQEERLAAASPPGRRWRSRTRACSPRRRKRTA